MHSFSPGNAHRGATHWRITPDGGERKRRDAVPTTGGRPLKKVMRIYFDGMGELGVHRRAERRAGERASLPRAAFVNDECVVARGGKLRGTRIRKGGARGA